MIGSKNLRYIFMNTAPVKEIVSENQGLFSYEGYDIPIDLMKLTGGGIDTWEEISTGHMKQYQRYCPILQDDAVLEIGCGIGRGAIQFIKHLSKKGSYAGIDIIQPSIEWCQKNISPLHPNFTFYFLDIKSKLYNPTGSKSVQETVFPLPDASVDRIVLQSVFTHMFRDDIVHYLKECRRVLKSTGKILASFFILDEETLGLIKQPEAIVTFHHQLGEECYVNNVDDPEGAVGHTPEGVQNMLDASNMMLDQPIHHGFWSGRKDVPDGQDVLVFRPQNERL